MILNYRAFFSDGWNLVKKLTLIRLWNLSKISVSYQISIRLKKAKIWAGPYSLHFETAAVCNLKCPECTAGTGKTLRTQKMMPLESIERKLQHHQKNAFYCNLYFQGEPFLNPRIFDIIHSANQFNYYTVISTNGHFLTEKNCKQIVTSGLNRLIVSLDGIDAASYSQYRKGGNYERVVEGIRLLHETRKRLKRSNPLLIVQFLVNKTNEHQLDKAELYIKNLGADVLIFKSMQIYSKEGLEAFKPANKSFDRYSALKNIADSRKCFRLWSDMVYTSDGIVVPCCYDKIPEYSLGNEDDIPSGIWKSDEYMKMRNQLLTGKNIPHICNNCLP